MSWLAPLPHEIVSTFMTSTTRLRQDQLDALAAQRIPLWALAGAPGSGEFGIGFTRATPSKDARFEFTTDGARAMAVVALNEFGEAADIVAWGLRCDWVASWLGRLSMLGARDAFGPRLDTAITIHPDPMSWLQNDRRGVVLVNPRRAARELADAGPLLAANVEHGERLESLMTLSPPTILVALPNECGESLDRHPAT